MPDQRYFNDNTTSEDMKRQHDWDSPFCNNRVFRVGEPGYICVGCEWTMLDPDWEPNATPKEK